MRLGRSTGWPKTIVLLHISGHLSNHIPNIIKLLETVLRNHARWQARFISDV